MRPHDIVILLKVICYDGYDWRMADLARDLFISPSEISESLNRSKLAGLIDYNKKNVNRNNLIDFIEHGLRFVFPVQTGTIAKGMPTAHSHEFFADKLFSETNYVWPDIRGEASGLIVEPFYEKQVQAIKKDKKLYLLLALTDVMRVGRIRERNIAMTELKAHIIHESTHK